MPVLETIHSNLASLTNGDVLWFGLILLLLALIIIFVLPGIKRIKIWIAGTGVEVERTSPEKPTEKTGIKSDSITAQGPMVGTAKTVTNNIYNYTIKLEPDIEEKREEAVKKTLSPLPQSSRVPTEEHQGKMESLQTELNQERLEKAKILTERSKERQDAGKYTEAKEDLEKALEILEGLECKKNSRSK